MTTDVSAIMVFVAAVVGVLAMVVGVVVAAVTIASYYAKRSMLRPNLYVYVDYTRQYDPTIRRVRVRNDSGGPSVHIQWISGMKWNSRSKRFWPTDGVALNLVTSMSPVVSLESIKYSWTVTVVPPDSGGVMLKPGEEVYADVPCINGTLVEIWVVVCAADKLFCLVSSSIAGVLKSDRKVVSHLLTGEFKDGCREWGQGFIPTRAKWDCRWG